MKKILVFAALMALCAAQAECQSKAISRGYDALQLGSPYEQVLKTLESSSAFYFNGLPDVTMSGLRDQKILEVRGSRYIDRAVLQFKNGTLFTIILILNPLVLDHFSLYTAFVAKYGDPQFLSPRECTWEDGSTVLTLDSPLTLRYVDKSTLSDITAASNIEASRVEQTRDDFVSRL